MYYLVWIASLLMNFYTSEPNISSNEYLLERVNEVRSEGCYCGRKYMKPVEPVTWNSTLYSSAMNHAKHMNRYDHFSHYSVDGKNIGERIEAVGYKWHVVGENLAVGQTNFEEVLRDWIRSKEHCVMLMDPRVTEMGIARYRKYWVQHFGKPLPKGAKVKRKVYRN
jgi:uncharacterized protein YkwD